MENWNSQLFLALNGPSTPDPWILQLATLFAQDLVYLGPVFAAGLWIWGAPGRRGGL